MRRTTSKRLALGVAVVAAAAALSTAGPLALQNVSPSIPLGWYVRTWRTPVVGSVIAFRVPAAAIDYVGASPATAFYLTHPLLKAVVAGPGETICREPGGAFSVDGTVLGTAAAHDSQGTPLPTWSGCRRLMDGELAVFSARIPNSFDSRYYGAVAAGEVIGVFVPVAE